MDPNRKVHCYRGWNGSIPVYQRCCRMRGNDSGGDRGTCCRFLLYLVLLKEGFRKLERTTRTFGRWQTTSGRLWGSLKKLSRHTVFQPRPTSKLCAQTFRCKQVRAKHRASTDRIFRAAISRIYWRSWTRPNVTWRVNILNVSWRPWRRGGLRIVSMTTSNGWTRSNWITL